MSNTTKTALVTGASRGIGRAIAERLANDGYSVIVNYAGNKESAQETVSIIQAKGGQAVAIQADIASDEDVKRLFNESMAINGQLDAVIHNAGMMTMTKITPEGLADFDQTIQTNLRGAFLVLAYAAQHLTDGGRIVAISSSVIAKSFPAYGPYIASKSAVEGLVHVLANELAGRNITVNAIAPGPIATELFFTGKTEAQINAMAKMSPLGRIGTPEEVANAVASIVGPDGNWINSQVIRVNGGLA